MASLSSPPPLSLSTDFTTTTAHRDAFGFSRFVLRRKLGFIFPKVVHVAQINKNPSSGLLTELQSLTPLNCNDSTCEKLCKINWSIEAVLLEGAGIICLMGDPIELGSWDPDSSIHFFPSLFHPNLWEAQIMVPYGINFKYNYFIKNGRSIWGNIYRMGPKLSLSTPPFSSEENKEIRVRDCWRLDSYHLTHRFRVPSWDSWLFDPNFLKDPFVHKPENQESNHQALFSGIRFLNGEKVETSSIKKKKIPSEDIRTKILINSSACNMQRIAVLENEKLVELFVEPIKDQVAINNIYLGVVKKVDTQKGGAYVDIGQSKPAFMAMRENIEPFVYGTNWGKKEISQNGGEICKNGINVSKGSKIIVQVIEGEDELVNLTPYPRIRSRFWMLIPRHDTIEISDSIKDSIRSSRIERFISIAMELKPNGFGLKLQNVPKSQFFKEFKKDLKELLSTWNGIVQKAESAILASRRGVNRTVPVMLYRSLDHNLSLFHHYFPDKVDSVLVDSPGTYHEVTIGLQENAPNMCDRVKLYDKINPIFDEYNIEDKINKIYCKRVDLPHGGYLVMEETDAFVSIDVNSGGSKVGSKTSQEKAHLLVNLSAAKQIARELRLRDIGGVIVVDFIDMVNDSNRRALYEEMKSEVERDRSSVTISKISSLGLMQITRERVHRTGSFVASVPCECCHATGRVEGLERCFSKIEHEIARFLAAWNLTPNPNKAKEWPRFILKVDRNMCDYLTIGKVKKHAILSRTLKVWIILETGKGLSWGEFELTPEKASKLEDN